MIERFLPYSPERDVYRLLQVDPGAGIDEILEAWRRLARTFHPDRNGSGRANEEMQVVNAVRDLLTDPRSRAVYDRERQRWMATATADVSRAPTSGGDLPGPGPGAGWRPPAAAFGDSPVGRRLLAVGLGLRAFGAELLPARCERCNGAVGRREPRCSICGYPTRAPRLP